MISDAAPATPSGPWCPSSWRGPSRRRRGRSCVPGWPDPAAAARAETVEAVPSETPPQEDTALAFDLFDALPAEESDEEVVARLERELLEPAVRSDASRLAELLHPSFEEIGRSGRLWGRDALVAELADERPFTADLEVLGVDRVAPEALLLTARTTDDRGATLRSSLWVRSSGRCSTCACGACCLATLATLRGACCGRARIAMRSASDSSSSRRRQWP